MTGMNLRLILLAVCCFILQGCATYAVRDSIARIPYPTKELARSEQILVKYWFDAVIDNEVYYIFYSDSMLYGKNRRGYFLGSKTPREIYSNGYTCKFRITDNLAKYELFKSEAKGYAILKPYVADAVIGTDTFHYDIGLGSSYDVRWVNRSYTEYIIAHGLYLFSVPYDIVTSPILAVLILATPQ